MTRTYGFRAAILCAMLHGSTLGCDDPSGGTAADASSDGPDLPGNTDVDPLDAGSAGHGDGGPAVAPGDAAVLPHDAGGDSFDAGASDASVAAADGGARDGGDGPGDAAADDEGDAAQSDGDAASGGDAGPGVDPDWSCEAASYGGANGCDCSCGVQDPDCAGAEQCDHAPLVDLVVVSSDEVQGNGASLEGAVSDDGRFVVFATGASNLVSGDANGQTDVYVRDRVLGTTRRVSVGLSGVDADGSSSQPSISADGRFVAFVSSAKNLIESDTNLASDAFVADLDDGSIERVATSVARCQLAANGKRVVFDMSGASGIKVYDREEKTTTLVSKDPSGTAFPSSQFGRISADGKFVVFAAASRIYRHEIETSTSVLVSVSSTGTPSGGYIATVSATGRYVAFQSGDSDLVEGDTNGVTDVFLRDVELAATKRISVSASGEENVEPSQVPFVSADGQRVVFTGRRDASGWGNVTLWDGATSSTRVVAPGVSNAVEAISANGRWATFSSYTSNLVPSDTNGTYDLFVVPLDE